MHDARLASDAIVAPVMLKLRKQALGADEEAADAPDT
jgi:hypothetical protein